MAMNRPPLNKPRHTGRTYLLQLQWQLSSAHGNDHPTQDRVTRRLAQIAATYLNGRHED
jgi:hypothetical protein